MKTEKMSFRKIKDVLSRDEMKKILAGSGITCGGNLAGYGHVSGACSGSTIAACETACTNAGYTLCFCH